MPELKDKSEDKYQVRAFYDPKTKLAIASTAVLDRQEEIIDQKGWVLDNFKNNNPLLWAHNSYEPLIGNCKNTRVEKMMGEDKLVFEPDFHEETELAKAVGTLYAQGRLKTFSVGFKPMEMDGNKYTKQELLEISAVNIPANPEAQMLAYRSLSGAGFKKDVITEVLKGGVADELANPDDYELKEENMRPVFKIFWAMCDVYFSEAVAVDDFNPLIKETASLMSKVANGTYTQPGSVKQYLNQVLDKDAKSDNDKGNEAKVPRTASKYHEERIRQLKVIAKATQVLNRGKNDLPLGNQKQLINVINRASAIVIEQHKGELKNG